MSTFRNEDQPDVATQQAHLIQQLSEENMQLKARVAELEKDKARMEWLQSVYSQTLKNNPNAPFGLLSIPLDLNYDSLRAALDAAMKGAK